MRLRLSAPLDVNVRSTSTSDSSRIAAFYFLVCAGV